MKVTTIAYTKFDFSAYKQHMTGFFPDEDTTDADSLAELSGRTCYLSYGKPNPKTAANADYLRNILEQQHTSVLEHASISFYVTGVSRNMLLELERHRHLSFSVVSTRYVDANKLNIVVPPLVVEETGCSEMVARGDRPDFDEFWEEYDVVYKTLSDRGYSKKKAREAAIAAMPGNLETRFVVTGNVRALRDVLSKRLSPTANAEIRQFAELVLAELRVYAPNSVSDLGGNDG